MERMVFGWVVVVVEGVLCSVVVCGRGGCKILVPGLKFVGVGAGVQGAKAHRGRVKMRRALPALVPSRLACHMCVECRGT